MNMPFHGAKLAVLSDGRLPVILRDECPDIPWPGYWDLPGGGREGREDPLACALREAHEEFGLKIARSSVIWGRRYDGAGTANWFFVAHVPGIRLAHIRLGDEGQEVTLMEVGDFLDHPRVVPHFRQRLQHYFQDAGFHSEKPPAADSGGR